MLLTFLDIFLWKQNDTFHNVTVFYKDICFPTLLEWSILEISPSKCYDASSHSCASFASVQNSNWIDQLKRNNKIFHLTVFFF